MTDKELFKNTKKYMEKEVCLEGWIRNHRKQSRKCFYCGYQDGLSDSTG